MGEMADLIIEQGLDRIALGMDCGKCGANLEWEDHKPKCKAAASGKE